MKKTLTILISLLLVILSYSLCMAAQITDTSQYYSLPCETIKVDDSITKSPTINQSLVTGLILDCRNSSPERKMAPVIYDEDGQVIYSSENITYEVMLNSGLCDYVAQSSKDFSRAGRNPLTIKSMALSDFNRDFVVSRADGAKILAANAQSGMLGKAAMIVLIAG